MKQRNGFVSNSSSASFVVRWTWKGENIEKKTLEDAIKKILPMWMLDSEKKEFDGIYGEIKKALDGTRDNDWFYETSFFTTMYNCAEDFGPAAALFVVELLANDFKIDVSIEEDH